MGFLAIGAPLTWDEAMKHLAYIREHGIDQFLATFKRVEDGPARRDLYWGDEVEYHVVRLVGEGEDRTAKISLCAPQVLEALAKEEAEQDPE